MSDYGLLPEGLIRKPATVIKQELDDDFKGAFGTSCGSEPDGSIPVQSSMGQEINILVDLASLCWELAEAVDAAGDPGQSGGAAQDHLCAITGTTRHGRQFSLASCVFVGAAGTLLRAGRVVSVAGTKARFDTNSTKSLAVPPVWGISTHYVPGDIVTNAGKSFVCWFSGVSSGGGPGPNVAGTDVVDGTVHWRGYAGVWPGAVVVDAIAEVVGPIAADLNTLVNIETPVPGVTLVTNYQPATVGVLREEDADLRVRREAELGAQGTSTPDGIRAAILQLKSTPPVTNCEVYYNDQDFAVDGLPGHSCEVLVEGGDDDDVALGVWRAVGAGITKIGNQTTSVVDAAGKTRSVNWSRPVPLTVYVDVTGTYDATKYPTDGDAQLIALVVAYGALLKIGHQVRSQPIGAVLVPDQVSGEGVAGVLEITQVLIGYVDPPVASTTLAVAAREKATITTVNVDVHMSPGSP